jgi:hypothetical protein
MEKVSHPFCILVWHSLCFLRVEIVYEDDILRWLEISY